jgi:3-hydroxyisobutyrate dehydrogenase-like beta-hydroxyacid dehydrogenase
VSTTVGFIGFGEVASLFSSLMKDKGADLLAYDKLQENSELQDMLFARASAAQVCLRSLPEVVGRSDIVLSTVTTLCAVEVAENCAKYLNSGQVYIDLNSTAPSVKLEVAAIVGKTSATFAEGVILDAVGASGASSRILIGGPRGDDVAGRLRNLGLNAKFFSPALGRASSFKMLRSIFTKGAEALLIELLLSGRKAGVDADLWADLVEFMTKNPFEKVASNWIRTHAVACERRHAEMEQVVATMKDIGVEPLMTVATEEFFGRSVRLGVHKHYSDIPQSSKDTVRLLEEALLTGEALPTEAE